MMRGTSCLAAVVAFRLGDDPKYVPENARFEAGGLSSDFSVPVTGATVGTADKGKVKLNASGTGFQRSH